MADEREPRRPITGPKLTAEAARRLGHERRAGRMVDFIERYGRFEPMMIVAPFVLLTVLLAVLAK